MSSTGEVLDDHAERAARPSTGLKGQLRQAALLTFGAALAGIAHVVAGWVVGMFAATLPLPPGAHLAMTILAYSALVYYVALDVDEDGRTRLSVAIGRVSR